MPREDQYKWWPIKHIQLGYERNFTQAGSFSIVQKIGLCGIRFITSEFAHEGEDYFLSKAYYPGKRPTWYYENEIYEWSHEFYPTSWMDIRDINCQECLNHKSVPLYQLSVVELE